MVANESDVWRRKRMRCKLLGCLWTATASEGQTANVRTLEGDEEKRRRGKLAVSLFLRTNPSSFLRLLPPFGEPETSKCPPPPST